jgi:exosortase/archaeosortase family protein
MLSLFFGEFYLLKARRRALLVLSGFGMACLFNVGRTTLLTWVAARDGLDAISHWHDPAGVTILVACFLGLWGIGTAMRMAPAARVFPSAGNVTHSLPLVTPASAKAPDSLPFSAPRPLLGALCALALWLVVVEIGVGLWYRHVEAGQAAQPTWQVAWPAEEAGFRSVPIPQKSTEMLHYDEAEQAQWTEADGTRWQLSWFYWKAGKAAGYLAKSHNPLVCMPAAGYQVSAISPPQFADLSGLRFPFRIYTFEKEGHTLYVLYSRWDDRAAEQSFATEGLTRFNRLRSVWSGRGNHGQRVIGLALWGVNDPQGAREQLIRQLQHVLVVNPL